jgi:DNA-binding response OmpR family regulator
MRRILVVDDDAHVGQAIGLWLRYHGFRVSTAGSGASGLAALDDATSDMMIVDVFMPGMRGFEAIRLFQQAAARPAGVVFEAVVEWRPDPRRLE